MNKVVNMDSVKFEEFLRCLFVLKDICNDVDIRDGFLRQRSNDNASIIQMDLTSIIDTINLPITSLKKKLDLLKCFNGQEVQIEILNDSYIISDNVTSIKISNPKLEYIDNKFIDENELNNLFILNDEDLILSTTIPYNISDRIRVITQGFDVNSIKVMFEGNTATIKADTQARDQSAKFMNDIILEDPRNGYSNLVTTPFIIDHDGTIDFKMYNVHESICANKFSTAIKDVEIVVYGRSTINEDE